MVKLKVVFNKKLFSNEEGFSIFSATPTEEYKNTLPTNQWGSFSVNGHFYIDDEDLDTRTHTISIEKDVKSKYANSYKMKEIHYEFPTDAKEQWAYAEECHILTPLQLDRLKEAGFSEEKDRILDLFQDKNPRIKKVKGFKDKTISRVVKKISHDKNRFLVYKEFGKVHGVSPGLIQKILTLGPDVKQTIKNIKKNPFLLLKFDRVGFMVADKIRESVGISKFDKDRCFHGIKYYILDNFNSTGNTYADLNVDLPPVSANLEVPVIRLLNYLKDEFSIDNGKTLAKNYEIKIFGHYITTKELFDSEKLILAKTRSLLNDKDNILPDEEWAKNKEELLKEYKAELSEEQNTFLDLVNSERVLVLVGPGGAGKSWVTRLVCELLIKAQLSYGLYAPTARAARVMSDYTGDSASTIHRGLLKYSMTPAYFESNFDENSEYVQDDVLIIDEASMVDAEIMSAVYKSMKPGARIILIGDNFQLPSVGPGNVLYDLSNYLKIPTVELTKIFRQTEDSNILNIATNLRQSKFYVDKELPEMDMGDIKFINSSDNDRIAELGLSYYKDLVGKLDPENVMFLSPVNKGVCGKVNLNKEIQKIVNPHKSKNKEIEFGKSLPEEERTYFRENDYITIKTNNYEAKDTQENTRILINGDLGYVQQANDLNVTVEINGHSFLFVRDKVNENIEHVWSTTIHKSQGGQADAVIIVIPKNSAWQLSANMLYTAITRARKQCYIIGDFNVMNKSAKKFINYRRKTMLSLQYEQMKRKRESDKKKNVDS